MLLRFFEYPPFTLRIPLRYYITPPFRYLKSFLDIDCYGP